MRSRLITLLLLCVPAGGCRQGDEAPPPVQQAPTDYGTLPGLKATPDVALQDELARIVDEGGTPEQLSDVSIPAEENVAAALLDLFPDDRLDDVLARSEQLFPPGPFGVNPIELERMIQFGRRHETARARAREALERPRCDFGIEYRAGFLAEVKFIGVVRVGARLEAFHAAEALAGDRVDEAIASLRAMLQLGGWLGAEKHLEARLEAAFVRGEAFRVLQGIVLDRHVTPADLERLQRVVADHLAVWPDDADAWIGDRALGLHAYEMVRDGRLTALLTLRELDSLAKEGTFEQFAATARKNVTHDELYYLTAMRKIIESCRLPYYERAVVLRSILEDLQDKRNSPDFPRVAGRLLLADVHKAHVIQAQDRANWEAWALALALATGKGSPPYKVNPLTGENYLHATQDAFVVVENFGSGVDGDFPAIKVPRFVPQESNADDGKGEEKGEGREERIGRR